MILIPSEITPSGAKGVTPFRNWFNKTQGKTRIDKRKTTIIDKIINRVLPQRGAKQQLEPWNPLVRTFAWSNQMTINNSNCLSFSAWSYFFLYSSIRTNRAFITAVLCSFIVSTNSIRHNYICHMKSQRQWNHKRWLKYMFMKYLDGLKPLRVTAKQSNEMIFYWP